MANKVIQLIDKDNNNCYPLAGGMASASVTTAMLQDDAVTTAKINDGAVTSGKIDFTTIVDGTERVVGTYNGATLYENVFTGTTASDTVFHTILSGISTLFSHEEYVGTNERNALYYATIDGTTVLFFDVINNSGTIQYRSRNSSTQNQPYRIIARYTKSSS